MDPTNMSDPDLERAVISGVHGATAEQLRRHGNGAPAWAPSKPIRIRHPESLRKPAATARQVVLAVVVLPLASVGIVLAGALLGPVGDLMSSDGASTFGFAVGVLPAIGVLAGLPFAIGLLAGRALPDRSRWRWVLYAWAMALTSVTLLVAADPQLRSPVEWTT